MKCITIFVLLIFFANSAPECSDQVLGAFPKVVKKLPRPTKPFGWCHQNDGVNFFYSQYDEEVLHPNWVAFRLLQKNMNASEGGRRGFKKDPDLTANGIVQVSPNDPNVGYGTVWNRGHLGPSKAFSWDKSESGAWEQCYYTSNIAPQANLMNQKGWKALEGYIFNWAVSVKNRTLYVIVGTHYSTKNVTFINGGLGVPNYFYTVICDKAGKQSAGFVAKNVLGSGGDDAYTYWTVQEVQTLVGLDFGWSPYCNITSVNPNHWWE